MSIRKARKRRCLYGVKKSGECKKKPGPKKGSRRRRYITSARCKAALHDKIMVNMREYKNGRYSRSAQAIAVSYSQIGRKYPSCKRYLKRRSR